MIKEPWTYNREITASSTTGVGKTGQLHVKNETGLLSSKAKSLKHSIDEKVCMPFLYIQNMAKQYVVYKYMYVYIKALK